MWLVAHGDNRGRRRRRGITRRCIVGWNGRNSLSSVAELPGEIRAAFARGPLSAGDSTQHGKHRTDVRGSGCQAVVGEATGVSDQRETATPSGTGLLAALGVGGRGELGTA